MCDSLWPHCSTVSSAFHCLSDCSNSCALSQWCHPTISSSVTPSPAALNLSQHQWFFQWVGSSHQVFKLLEFQLQHQSFWWIFRVDFLWDQQVLFPCTFSISICHQVMRPDAMIFVFLMLSLSQLFHSPLSPSSPLLISLSSFTSTKEAF